MLHTRPLAPRHPQFCLLRLRLRPCNRPETPSVCLLLPLLPQRRQCTTYQLCVLCPYLCPWHRRNTPSFSLLLACLLHGHLCLMLPCLSHGHLCMGCHTFMQCTGHQPSLWTGRQPTFTSQPCRHMSRTHTAHPDSLRPASTSCIRRLIFRNIADGTRRAGTTLHIILMASRHGNSRS